MIAAVGPAMLKVAAEECDGVKLHGFCTRRYLTDEIMPRVEAGLAQGRPAPGAIRDFGRLAFSRPDPTTPRWRDASNGCASGVAFLWLDTGPYYPVLAAHGLEDLGHKLNALTRRGQWNEMAKEVPDDVAISSLRSGGTIRSWRRSSGVVSAGSSMRSPCGG